MDDRKLTPKEVRKLIREEKITGQTSGLCPGYAQANLLILPKAQAYDFLLFTQRNPRACPILEVTASLSCTGCRCGEGFPQIPHLSQGRNDRRVYEY